MNLEEGARYARFMGGPEGTPSTANRDISNRMAKQISCKVCRVVTTSLIGSATTHKEDDLINLLEDFKMSKQEVQSRLEKVFEQDEGFATSSKKAKESLQKVIEGMHGCARYFKDILLAKGWWPELCQAGTQHACLEQSDEHEVWEQHVYAIEKEALYQACKMTIGKNSEDMAILIAKRVKKELQTYSDIDDLEWAPIIEDACKKAGRCHKDKEYVFKEEL